VNILVQEQTTHGTSHLNIRIRNKALHGSSQRSGTSSLFPSFVSLMTLRVGGTGIWPVVPKSEEYEEGS
jgi:hypothetical protein